MQQPVSAALMHALRWRASEFSVRAEGVHAHFQWQHGGGAARAAGAAGGGGGYRRYLGDTPE